MRDETPSGSARLPCDAMRHRDAIKAVLALLFLNAMLSFSLWWPTPAIRPAPRLAPEFVLFWVLLLVAVRVVGTLSRRMLAAFGIGYLLLVVGRYADVVVPALFGRELNLYWDGPHALGFVRVLAQSAAAWVTPAMALAALLGLAVLYRLLRGTIALAARAAAPLALRSRAALALTAAAAVLASTHVSGVAMDTTGLLVSKPILPTYLRQADLMLTALSPARLATALPPSPAFDSDLGALAGADVKLVFIESYGAVAFDHPLARRGLAAGRVQFAQAIADSGRQVVSAFVRSPTFGGHSDLAHLGLLSGLDLSDPRRHDLLLTTTRPTLIDMFRARGYRTYGLYPALSWDWPERTFYRFDHFIEGRDLGYRGPQIGYWWIPDQYSIARFDQLHPIGPDSPPRLLLFPTINSHLPFAPLPPYQPDWQRLLSAQPFDAAGAARTLADKADWTNMLSGYLRSIDYTYQWLGGYLAQPAPREYLMILVGDHQPASSISGEGATWEVPVHVISTNPHLMRRFVEQGFRPGLEPQRPALGAMHDLTRVLLHAFASNGRL
jgi:hypothetical protein